MGRPPSARGADLLLDPSATSCRHCVRRWRAPRVAVHGIVGVGKTTLASRLCQDRQVRKAFDRVCWLTVGKAESLLPLQQAL